MGYNLSNSDRALLNHFNYKVEFNPHPRKNYSKDFKVDGVEYSSIELRRLIAELRRRVEADNVEAQRIQAGAYDAEIARQRAQQQQTQSASVPPPITSIPVNAPPQPQPSTPQPSTSQPSTPSTPSSAPPDPAKQYRLRSVAGDPFQDYRRRQRYDALKKYYSENKLGTPLMDRDVNVAKFTRNKKIHDIVYDRTANAWRQRRADEVDPDYSDYFLSDERVKEPPRFLDEVNKRFV
jgi:hypothetical protein